MAGIDSFAKLLLHCDGANGSTTFIDSATGKTVNVSGHSKITTAQSKFGGASGLFDGTGDFLTLNGEADFAFGTGDFTLDTWFRLNAKNIDQSIYDSRPASTQGLYPVIYISSANKIVYFTNSADRIVGTTVVTTETWYHIAIVRASGVTNLYVNGTQEGGNYNDANNYINGASRPVIGASGFNTATLNYNGWLDELRVSKGKARWTANFTPPIKAYSREIGFMIFL